MEKLNQYHLLEKEFTKIEELRKNIDMSKYEELKNFNKNDKLYNWEFENGDVLYENLEDLTSEYFHSKYIHDIGLVYIEILKKCQKDNNFKNINKIKKVFPDFTVEYLEKII